MIFHFLLTYGQKTDKKTQSRELVQFSGVVVENDSLKSIPFTSIMIKNSYRGTVSDYFGYFSFVAQENDTIVFSAIGFQKGYFVIPDTLSINKYSLIHVLVKDTIQLKEISIYPWPTREQFKDAFLKLDLPSDDLERARKNLTQAQLREKVQGLPMDGGMNYKYQMQQQYNRLYYAGQYPSISLLNPIAWAKFIEAWKRGDFKRKE